MEIPRSGKCPGLVSESHEVANERAIREPSVRSHPEVTCRHDKHAYTYCEEAGIAKEKGLRGPKSALAHLRTSDEIRAIGKYECLNAAWQDVDEHYCIVRNQCTANTWGCRREFKIMETSNGLRTDFFYFKVRTWLTQRNTKQTKKRTEVHHRICHFRVLLNLGIILFSVNIPKWCSRQTKISIHPSFRLTFRPKFTTRW